MADTAVGSVSPASVDSAVDKYAPTCGRARARAGLSTTRHLAGVQPVQGWGRMRTTKTHATQPERALIPNSQALLPLLVDYQARTRKEPLL